MAEEDEASKTEDPTDKKLGDARVKGDVAKSIEVSNWFILVGALVSLVFVAPYIAKNTRHMVNVFVVRPETIPTDIEHLRFLFSEILLEAGLILSPVFGLLFVLAISGNVFQSGLIWATEKIKPDLKKISIIKGFGRLFSTRALVEFVKGILKLLTVAMVAGSLAIPNLSDIELFPFMDILFSIDRIHLLAIILTAGTLAVMTAIAGADFVFQKHKFLKQMRMSRQDIKDEQKQSDGDPMVKARIRRIRTERAQQRMMAQVPEADVVITNPTHYSVALKYKMEEMTAPKLVAKGVDHLAFSIRELAKANDVPIVENPPLARALYAGVDLDEEIPAEHFQAVAEVIGYVMRLRGELNNQ